MKINTTLSHLDHHVGVLLHSTPITATRHGLLGLVCDHLEGADRSWAAEDLQTACTDLMALLDVPTVYEIPAALRARRGRPPKAVVAALRAPDVVAALCRGLDELDLGGLYRYAQAWGPQESGLTVPLAPVDRDRRAALVSALRRRAGEILAAWREVKVQWRAESVAVDGRTLVAAARAWQVPMINGEVLSPPESTAARYPNRLGKSAAAVAFARYRDAHCSQAPHEAFFEPLALLVTVGEAISRGSWEQPDLSRSLRGYVGLEIPGEGAPVPDSALSVLRWWPVFSAWGASGRREASAIPTAWRLSEAEGDVLVWALCSAAIRLALAGSLPQFDRAQALAGAPVPWREHVAAELPGWEAGARSLWALMQSTRDVSKRTAFPGMLLPGSDRESWPWFSPSADDGRLGDVPDLEEIA